ncbi:MAG: hypothetical protein HOP28_05780 [Gemmatimonadales bacterium]|nr:hypothetical protein [Gemmatimonadales bacterium]
MPRTFGLLARTFFGLNGLLTVWCLGCCGFEPMLNVGGGAMATPCAEELAALPGALQAGAATSTAPDASCSCLSCCAVSAVRFAVSSAAPEPLAQPVSGSVTLVSIAQEPRYPPPKAPRWT